MYELVFGIDSVLRGEGVRDRVPLTFITAEPYLGHLGLNQTAAQGRLVAMFKQRDIAFKTNQHVARVRPGEVVLSSEETVPAQESFLMPPFTGDVDIWKSANLTDDVGMIPVDESYRHIRHSDIYAAGVASVFSHPIPPLDQTVAPATGYLSLRMGKAAGMNIAASLGVGKGARRTLPRTIDIHVMDAGRGGLFLMSRGDQQLQNRAISLPRSSARYLKRLVEWYLVRGLSSGRV